jgi:hypothetical protein
MFSATGNTLLPNHDTTKPMLSTSRRYRYLTSNAKRLKEWSEIYSLAQSRNDLERRILDPLGTLQSDEERVALQRQLDALPKVPEEKQWMCRQSPSSDAQHTLTCGAFHDNCPFRVYAARAVNIAYEYVAFPDRESMLAELVKTAMTQTDNYWFVIVEFGVPLYLYMDFEEDRPTPGGSCSEASFFDRCRKALQFVLACYCALFPTADAAAIREYWLTACTEKKFSFHAHVKVPFADISTLCKFMELVQTALIALPADNKLVQCLSRCYAAAAPAAATDDKARERVRWIVDFTVYTGNRNFRAAFQRKFGDDNRRSLIPFSVGSCTRLTPPPPLPGNEKEGSVRQSKFFRQWIKRSAILLTHQKISDDTVAKPHMPQISPEVIQRFRELVAARFLADTTEQRKYLHTIFSVPIDMPAPSLSPSPSPSSVAAKSSRALVNSDSSSVTVDDSTSLPLKRQRTTTAASTGGNARPTHLFQLPLMSLTREEVTWNRFASSSSSSSSSSNSSSTDNRRHFAMFEKK